MFLRVFFCCTHRLAVSRVERDATAFSTTGENPGFGLVILDSSYGGVDKGVFNWSRDKKVKWCLTLPLKKCVSLFSFRLTFAAIAKHATCFL